MAEYLLREATVADAPTIGEHRRLMFQAMSRVDDLAEGSALAEAMRRYVERELPTGRFRGWIVETDGQPVAGGALLLQATPPAPGFRPSTTAMTLTLD